MRFHFARLGDDTIDAPARAFEDALLAQPGGRHSVAGSAQDADAILFTQVHMVGWDWRLRSIRENPLCARYGERIYVYDERDHPWGAFPGVYVSMPQKLLRPDRQRPWGYQDIADRQASRDPDLLFSLIASPTHACRTPLFRLDHPDAVVQRVENFLHWMPTTTKQEWDQRRAAFRDVTDRSHFVLCPRGAGTSSYRLYETMAAGRVPVIISDDWSAPSGIDWDAFSIRWPEHRTAGLSEMLTARLNDWPAMAAGAREAYEANFAKAASTERILDLVEVLHRNGADRSLRPAMDRSFVVAGAHAMKAQAIITARQTAKRLLRPNR